MKKFLFISVLLLITAIAFAGPAIITTSANGFIQIEIDRHTYLIKIDQISAVQVDPGYAGASVYIDIRNTKISFLRIDYVSDTDVQTLLADIKEYTEKKK